MALRAENVSLSGEFVSSGLDKTYVLGNQELLSRDVISDDYKDCRYTAPRP